MVLIQIVGFALVIIMVMERRLVFGVINIMNSIKRFFFREDLSILISIQYGVCLTQYPVDLHDLIWSKVSDKILVSCNEFNRIGPELNRGFTNA